MSGATIIDLDDYARQYAAQYAEDEFEPILARIRREKVLAALRAHPHRRVLEVGCGFEPLFPHVSECRDYWIVEPQGEAVAAARAHPAAGEGLHVVEGRLETVQGQLPRDFDFIVVSSLLHEVADPGALVHAVRAHCGAATVAHFNVPNVQSFHRLLALEAGLIADVFEKSPTEERFQRQTRFDRPRLVAFMLEHGFAVLESGTYYVNPFTHAQMKLMLTHQIIDMRIIEALDRMTRYMPELGCEMFVNVRRAG